jgi:hypothetical protein
MLVQQYPKPKCKRQKRIKYPPLFEMGYCHRCYTKHGLKRITGLHVHHLYGGNPDRQHSEVYGLYVHECVDCHSIITDERDKEYIAYLKQEGQRRFEAVHEHGRDEFIRIFGRNYL